jgi:AcrR family transcriptional regulator
VTSEEAVAESPRAQPRRQARGRQRIEQILHAAAAVFAEQGYDAATTNAIAAQAGISPGSLYQFFKNKKDIAHALAEHYAVQLSALRAEVFTVEDVEGSSLDDLVDAVLEPLVAFNLAHPGFKAIFARTDMPTSLREAVAPVHAAIHHRVTELIGAILPDRSNEGVARVATVAIQLVRGMMPLIANASEPERDALTAELRAVLASYLRQYASGIDRYPL